MILSPVSLPSPQFADRVTCGFCSRLALSDSPRQLAPLINNSDLFLERQLSQTLPPPCLLPEQLRNVRIFLHFIFCRSSVSHFLTSPWRIRMLSNRSWSTALCSTNCAIRA